MSINRQVFWGVSCLLVGITVVGAGEEEGKKAANQRLSPTLLALLQPQVPDKTSLVLEKPLPVDAKADEVTRLLIERRNAAVELLQATYALLLGGKGSLEHVAMAAERALAAQIEVPGSNKIQILEQHVTFARDLNKNVDERFNQGVVDATSHRMAKYLRLDMELRLAREKLGVKKNPA